MNEKRGMIWMLVLAAVFAAMVAGCLVPDNTYLMELNRKGKWKEAERIGQDMLAHRKTFTGSQICETYFHVIYAKTRMGKNGEAAVLMKEYDEFSAGQIIDSKPRWLDRETARLKAELGLLDDIQQTLVSAMEENEKGNYGKARELCGRVLLMSNTSEIQRATAHFVSAVCSIRLEDPAHAESSLAAFEELKPALPPDHQALAEEGFARQGLEELKKKHKVGTSKN